jgi:ribosomal-protein-alanine N-acetyltransferase
MVDDVDITTERLLLRRWRAADRDPWAAMNADPEVMRHFPATLTRAECDAAIDRYVAHFDEHGYGLWVVEPRDTGEFLGFVGVNTVGFDAHFTPALEIGWRLARHGWGHGYATEAARAVVDHVRSLGVEELVSFTVPANEPSWRVMERIGMTHDPADDFDHPRVPAGHPLEHHVLYRLRLRD